MFTSVLRKTLLSDDDEHVKGSTYSLFLWVLSTLNSEQCTNSTWKSYNTKAPKFPKIITTSISCLSVVTLVYNMTQGASQDSCPDGGWTIGPLNWPTLTRYSRQDSQGKLASVWKFNINIKSKISYSFACMVCGVLFLIESSFIWVSFANIEQVCDLTPTVSLKLTLGALKQWDEDQDPRSPSEHPVPVHRLWGRSSLTPAFV